MLIMSKKQNVSEIKTKLASLGAKTSGTKPILLKRLHDWNSKNLNRTLFKVTPLKSGRFKQFPSLHDQEYKPLNDLPLLEIDWLTPAVIHSYFSLRMANKGEEAGRKLFMRDFLKYMSFYKKGNSIFFMAKCSAEMRKNIDYRVSLQVVCLEREIIQTECECPAGKGPNAACKHIGALSYGIECFAVTGTAKQNASCTSVLQTWHKPSESGRMLKNVTVDEFMGAEVTLPPISSAVSNRFIQLFINNKVESPLLRSRICNLSGYINDHDYCKDRIEAIILKDINFVTKGEAEKLEKQILREHKLSSILRSRITASLAHKIVRTCQSEEYDTEFLKVHMQKPEVKSKKSKKDQWQIHNEGNALKKYNKIMNGEFKKCGIIVDSERHYLYAVPGGIDRLKTKILDIKCPYYRRFESPSTAACLSPYGLLKRNHPFYTEVQVKMHVSGVKSCDFIIYTTTGIHFESIAYDSERVETSVRQVSSSDWHQV